MITVNTLGIEDINSQTQYDLGFFAVGYEERSSFCWKKLNEKNIHIPISRRYAILFSNTQKLSFEKNKTIFDSSGFKYLDDVTDSLRTQVISIFQECSFEECIRLFVDISSMTRTHIAIWVHEVNSLAQRFSKPIIVDFAYARAIYSEPPTYGPVRFRGPVIPEFSGWSIDSEAPISLVLGLGYEDDIGLGFLEDLEPEKVVLFKPVGHEQLYIDAIEKANSTLIGQVGLNAIVEYYVNDPHAMIAKLVSVCNQLIKDYRPVLIPFGPRSFSLACCICALIFGQKIAVWRVSPVEPSTPIDRFPSGDISLIQLSAMP